MQDGMLDAIIYTIGTLSLAEMFMFGLIVALVVQFGFSVVFGLLSGVLGGFAR